MVGGKKRGKFGAGGGKRERLLRDLGSRGKKKELELRYRTSTHHLANRAFHSLLPSTLQPSPPIPPNMQRAVVDHVEDSFLLEAVGAFAACEGYFHGEEGQGAFDADALGGDFYVVVVVGSLVIDVVCCCYCGLVVGKAASGLSLRVCLR